MSLNLTTSYQAKGGQHQDARRRITDYELQDGFLSIFDEITQPVVVLGEHYHPNECDEEEFLITAGRPILIRQPVIQGVPPSEQPESIEVEQLEPGSGVRVTKNVAHTFVMTAGCSMICVGRVNSRNRVAVEFRLCGKTPEEATAFLEARGFKFKV